MIRHGQKQYRVTMASNVQRDGMALEIEEEGYPSRFAEVFYHDESHEMTITTFGTEFPLAVIEELIAQAKARLPPRSEDP